MKIRDRQREILVLGEKKEKLAQEYFRLAWRVMGSTPYAISALNHVFPN
jgi:hypothetical protein